MPDQAELDAFFDRLDRFLVFATKELGATPGTFTVLPASFRASSC